MMIALKNVLQAHVIVLLLLGHGAMAQSNPVESIIPSTPNVAALVKYGNVPMGLYTGQQTLRFPLYEIKYPDYAFPIALSYSYSGCKVEEYPGWTGAGWTVQAGGVITRQPRGVFDERADGYNGKNKRGEDVAAFLRDGMDISNPAYKNFLNGVKDGRIDSEPDLFFFSLPGLSGKFFFDETQCSSTLKEDGLVVKTAVVTPHQNIQVKGYFDYDRPYSVIRGIIQKFEVLDQRGVRYVFDVLEKAAGLDEDRDNGNAKNDYGNAWHLSQIQTPFNNNIRFEYKFRTLDNPPVVYDQLVLPDNFSSVARYNQTSTTEAVLERIRFRDGSITFIEAETPRLDWDSNKWTTPPADREQPKALARMRVSVAGADIKQIDFKYSYFGFNARLRLDSFQESNETQSMPPYRFEYDDGPFPRIGDKNALFSQDHWGYFTNTNSTTLLSPFFGTVDGSLGQLPFATRGNLRLPNEAAARSGLLTRITYPYGGTTLFEYEPHDFYSPTPPGFVPPKGHYVTVGDLKASTRCTTIKDDTHCFIGERTLTTSFTLETPVYGRVMTALSLSNCGESSASVLFERKATKENIFTRNFYQNARGEKRNSLIGEPEGTILFLTAGEYELTVYVSVESSCTSTALTKPAAGSISFEAFVPNKGGDNYLAGGFRVKQMTDCDRAGVAGCVTKRFSYANIDHPTRSSGVLMSTPVYSHPITLLNGNGSQVEQSAGVILSASSFVPVTGTQGSSIGYQYVTEILGENGEGGKTIHKFTSGIEYPDEVDYSYPFQLRTDNDWQRGLEVDVQYMNHVPAGDVLQKRAQSTYETATLYSRSVGLKATPKILVIGGLDYTLQITDYSFNAYSLTSGKMQQTYSVTTTVAGGLEHFVSSTFAYENPKHGLVTRTETTNSTGETLTTTSKYIHDVDAVAGLTATEISGIASNPDKTALIEKIDSKNSETLSTVRNLYDGPRLTAVQQSFSSAPLENKYVLGPYDSDGHVLQSEDKQGNTVSYLYGYANQYLIAAVRNALANEVFHTSFEDTGTVQRDAQNRLVAKTGGRVLLASTYNFPQRFQPARTDLLMSYWYRTAAGQWQFSEEPFARTITCNGTMLDEIRVYPPGASMVTYTVKPGVGMTSTTDANQVTSYFEYDALGRLSKVRDQDKNVIKNLEYGFATAQE